MFFSLIVNIHEKLQFNLYSLKLCILNLYCLNFFYFDLKLYSYYVHIEGGKRVARKGK